MVNVGRAVFRVTNSTRSTVQRRRIESRSMLRNDTERPTIEAVPRPASDLARVPGVRLP